MCTCSSTLNEEYTFDNITFFILTVQTPGLILILDRVVSMACALVIQTYFVVTAIIICGAFGGCYVAVVGDV